MDTTPIETVAERLAWLLKSWTSIEWRVRLDYRNLDRTTSTTTKLFDAYEQVDHYVETATGQRLYEEQLRPTDPASGSTTVNYSDGKRSANLYRRPDQQPDEGQVRITRSFGIESKGSSHRPSPFNTFYFGAQSLDKAIRKAVPLGEGAQAGRPCDLFLLQKDNGGESVVYFLDRETSVPLKVVHYKTEADRQADRVEFEWSGTAIERREGYPIVPTSELTHYRHDASGAKVALYRLQYRVEDFRINQTYEAATFWPEITPRMNVLDLVSRKATFPKRSESSKSITQEAGTHLIPEERSFPQTAIFVGLGLVLIAVAGWLRWRRSS